MLPSSRPRLLAAVIATTLLAACGGNEDAGFNDTVAGVSSYSIEGTPMYNQELVFKLQGRNLDKPITPVGGGGCASIARSSTEPYVSDGSTAYYRCALRQVGSLSLSFVRPSDSVMLATFTYAVPEPQVTLKVSNDAGVAGDIVLTLNATRAPITVRNFLTYVSAGFYTDTIFHRLVPDFIIQGGGYAKTVVPGGTMPTLKTTRAAIGLEDNVGLSNLRGTIAMARTSEVASATSQFFFNLGDNTSLDRNTTTGARGYAVFGTITGGIEMLTTMAAAPCSAWPEFFDGDSPAACMPNPNLFVVSATQTR